MYLIIFSLFANSSTDIMHLNKHARPGVTAYVGIDNKRMKYVKGSNFTYIAQKVHSFGSVNSADQSLDYRHEES